MSPLPDNVCPFQGRLRCGGPATWMFEAIATALEPRPMSPTRRRALRERLLDRVASRRQASVTVRRHEGDWLPLAPGVCIKLLRHDVAARNMTAYIHMAPGTSLDAHTHAQAEECLVLEGEIFIGLHRLSAGDLHLAQPGTRHETIRSPRGARLLVRAEARPPT
jgi:anti-sigma factor ChrR (cupin superfamily)